MGIIGMFNPYTYIVGGVIVAAISGSFYYQSTQIHKYHTSYDATEDQIVRLEVEIKNMAVAQKNQTDSTGKIITQVITVPGKTQTIVKTIHDAPVTTGCTTPAIDVMRNET